MRSLGETVRVVTYHCDDDTDLRPGRYSGTIGEIIEIVKQKPALYRIMTTKAKEYREEIPAGFTLLVFADEIRKIK